ncbi:phosphate/phosphite/phosphonate ABC transporter substrate-binding protein [Geopsychrobacter electrodiphilus]|uniref:phosphate/phosphite/phosphonate ABC transporter substrate-binding protein n=1 Tax=Geopsychrobacter electrodiphilus TaxID=225196 RepID=UPI000373D345|nr:phosphate/phosphite/phosphonate ABC transporter substrate-binding protein [Geopsychrobacter electrodiphilus]
MKSLIQLLHLLTLLVPLFLLMGCQPEGTRQKMRIGYMNCNSEKETLQRFRPLTRYLSQKLGIDFEAVPVDTQDFPQRFAAGEFEFTHTNSLLYLILHKESGLKLLATEKRGRYGSSTSGSIISRKGSGIKTLEDIKGKRMVFGPQLAPSGFLAQYDIMLRNHIDPETDLAYYAIPAGAFKHEKVIYGVYFGQFDVGAAPSLDLELMIADGKIAASDFNIIAESPIIPYCTFGARKDLDPALVEKFRQTLVSLSTDETVNYEGEKLKVLASAWVSGYETLQDSDYDQLRAMAKRANMPPYQEF